MKRFIRLLCWIPAFAGMTVFSMNALAALPFVTDDAFIATPRQLVVETFAEQWTIPVQPDIDKSAAKLYGYYLSGSYGLTKRLEFTAGALAAYDVKAHNASFMNPLMQLKAQIFRHENLAIPAVALDFGYVNKNGSGEYFDPANNYYAIMAASSHLIKDKLVIHLNVGKKASHDIPTGHLIRNHLGIGIDVAVGRKDIRFLAESYNGAVNSPRDSPNYFHSYQVGMKWIKHDRLAFHMLYGSQPTFAGYDNANNMVFRRTSWIQFGMRMIIGGELE